MAFGALLGTLSLTGTDIGASNALTGSVAVAVGDLVFVAFTQTTNLTASGVTDNLSNTYSAVNAGTDPGSPTTRAFYARVTNAGTLTTVTVAATASANDFAGVAAAIEGPFAAPPLDANPANASDIASPFTCPSTGTLAQADEAVLCWASPGLTTNAFAATSPNLLALQAAAPNGVRAVIGYQAVAATTAVAPEFTCADNPAVCTVGTASFMKAAAGGSAVGVGLTESVLLGKRRLAA